MDEVSARRFSLRGDGGDTGNARLILKWVAIYDFASFMMLFNDIFMNDEFYTDFGMTDDIMTSNIIGSGAQFEAKLVRLSPTMSLRTSSDASSRLTEGCCIVLKRPRLSMDPLTHKFTESGTIASIVNEFRVISHPALRQHPNILDVYGFAWETEDYLPGVSVWPIIMVEFGDLGALDQYLSARLEPLDLETKLRLASGISHGVDALHECRIIHSDLKPGNVLVVQGSDGKPVAKLSDFGISLILDERQSPSKWMEGSAGWMAPDWQTSCTNEQLFSTDVYSCGLLFWSILLDGKTPWSLDVFGTQDGLLSFEAAKKAEDGIADIALATVLESPAIPEERADEIGSLLRSLLASSTERSLGPLLLHLNELHLPDLASLSLKPTAGRVLDDRPIFPDYHELQNLPHAVKNQILQSISKIGLSENEGRQRKVDACYTVAMLHLQRIGTVRLKEPKTTEYIGYEIECDGVLRWLRRAAELGSPSAQAMYYPLHQALGTYLETKGRHAEKTLLGSVEPLQVIAWLKNATALGSDIASQYLRDLDPSSWEQGRSLLRSKYCGVGRVLFSEGMTPHRDISLSFPGKISAFDMVGPDGDTLLHLAATTGREDDCIRLCHGASCHDVNRQNGQGETPLLQATRSGHFKIVKHLLTVGANAGLTTSNGENVLHWLSSFTEEKEDMVHELASTMIKSGALLEQICSESTVFNLYFSSTIGAGTPLCRAVQRNAYIAAKVLVEFGANPYNGEGNFPMALACSFHNTRFIGLFLESECPIRLPGWHDRPGLWDPEHTWEVLKAKWRKEKTFQSAAPNAWKSCEERGTEDSLLGYVVLPKSIHLRMALHGAQYFEQMQLSIQAIANLGSQSFRRVTWDYQSALLHSIQSRDVSIVSYLHETFPEETRKALTNPVPTSLGACLPIQLALKLGDWLIFDLLLHLAGPGAAVDITDIEGMTDNLLSQTAMWLFKRRYTIAGHHVSSSFKTLIHLATAAHPDPHFMEAILSPLPANEARELVNSHGNADELPLTMAVCRHFFAVADVLLKYGADIEEEGNEPPECPGLGRSCLGVVLNFNNRGTARAISWILTHNPSFIVNRRHDLSALSMAIRSGGTFEISKRSPLLPVRLYREDTQVLEKILAYFSQPAFINHQWKDEKALYGATALHWAILGMQPKSIELLLAAGADSELDMCLPDGSRTMTAKELALGFDEDTIPEEVKERGEGEIQRHLKRFEDVKRLFTWEALQ